MNLSKSLKKHASAWPPSGSVSNLDARANFTISMNDVYRYPLADDALQPDDAFGLAKAYLNEIRMQIVQPTSNQSKKLEEFYNETFVSLIFGSNAIERVGCEYEETRMLCLCILNGEYVRVPKRTSDYEVGKITYAAAKESIGIVRSRAEVVQHALALKYMVGQVVIANQPISEAIICQTHSILCSDLPLEDKSGDDYAGVYRTCSVVAGFSAFTDHRLVPEAMRTLVQDLRNDLEEAKSAGKLDQFMLASKYCHQFVNIHPFVDGNGRMCRLILNVLLLKYAGIVVGLGEKDGEREEYLAVAANASIAEQLDVDQTNPFAPAWSELATLVLTKGTGRLKQMRELFYVQ